MYKNMEKHDTRTSHKEHGTTRSYVVGYILSLVFTFIPYFMVVNKYLTGNALIATILSIGLLQMVVQLVFFLHLGRGPKPLYNVVFFFATFGIVVITVGASVIIMNNLYHNMSPEELTRRLAQKENITQISGQETGACNENKNNHVVTISGGTVGPAMIQAGLCDTLTVASEDGVEREIVFGIPPERESYGGEFEFRLDGSRPEIITLNQLGDFTFYDANDHSVIGHFSVVSVE